MNEPIDSSAAIEFIEPYHGLAFDGPEALRESRRLRTVMRRGPSRNSRITPLDVTRKFCVNCQRYHVVLKDGSLDPTDRAILKKIAAGLRVVEIASDFAMPITVVRNRVAALLEHFDALSLAHLTVLAIRFGVITITDISPKEREL